MTYVPHYHLTFGGSLMADGTAVEQWSSGLRVMGYDDGQPNVAQPATEAGQGPLLSRTVTPLAGFFQSPDSGISEDATLDWVKVAAVDAQGHYTGEASVHYYPAGSTKGGVPVQAGSGTRYPFQIALAVTLETQGNGKRGTRGRIFLPAPGMTIGADRLISEAVATSISQRVRALVQAISANVNNNSARYAVAVVSKVGTPGPWNVVTATSVDTRLDVIRSRASSQRGSRVRG